ncbi:MAG: hypothetical protein KW804_01295 [Candidatus Doudnabacteria bacterium]|nr:hypothetical protein [Candidatus Doudnabacteria bacterium]
MSEKNRNFERDLKLNLQENLETELIVKQEQLQELINAERIGQHGTEESIDTAHRLRKEIINLQIQIKKLKEQNDTSRVG